MEGDPGDAMMKKRMDSGLYGVGVVDRHLVRSAAIFLAMIRSKKRPAAANADSVLAC
jgi:hypothetical protein